MTPEAQRVAIAEACPSLFVAGRSRFGDACLYRTGTHDSWFVDPLNDLNAMHEVEMSLPIGQRWFLTARLAEAVPAEEPIASATAAQRAEAFLKMICKWEDDK